MSAEVLAIAQRQYALMQSFANRFDGLEAQLDVHDLARRPSPNRTPSAASKDYDAQAVETVRPSARAWGTPRQGCARHCKCQCHRPAAFHTPPWMRRLAGSLVTQFSRGIWAMQGRCDVPVCRGQDGASIWVAYSFPTWLLGRAILLSASWGSLTNAGASLHITVPRVSEPYYIYRAIHEHYPEYLKEKVAQRQLTPADVTRDGVGYLSVG